MRHAPLALLALAAAGCAYLSDPKTSALPTGRGVVTYSDNPRHTYCLVRVAGEAIPVTVNLGTRATVVEDKAGTGDEERDVRIRVTEGEKAETVGTVPRRFLRPAP